MEVHAEQPQEPMPGLSRPLMQQLRDTTHTLHQLAERQEFQLALMRGRLPQPLFVAYLEQLWLIHERLETSLATVAVSLPAVAQVVQPYHYHAPRLCRDLRSFARDLNRVQPLPATATLLAQLETYATRTPVALLGVHYVLEGSKNGGRFQAAKVREAYGLSKQIGTEYLDPYGSQQRHLWEQYQTVMNALALSSADREAILAGATATFLTFIEMCQALMALDGAGEARLVAAGHGRGIA